MFAKIPKNPRYWTKNAGLDQFYYRRKRHFRTSANESNDDLIICANKPIIQFILKNGNDSHVYKFLAYRPNVSASYRLAGQAIISFSLLNCLYCHRINIRYVRTAGIHHQSFISGSSPQITYTNIKKEKIKKKNSKHTQIKRIKRYQLRQLNYSKRRRTK